MNGRGKCSLHAATYQGLLCPACEAERESRSLRSALREVNNKLALAHEELLKLRVETSTLHAIRAAIPLLDDSDTEFFKVMLYAWRDEKSLTLKITRGARKGKVVPPANGFVVMPRKGDPHGHRCTSVGGLAIAEYFGEAISASGPANAMVQLTKGLAPLLPGGTK